MKTAKQKSGPSGAGVDDCADLACRCVSGRRGSRTKHRNCKTNAWMNPARMELRCETGPRVRLKSPAKHRICKTNAWTDPARMELRCETGPRVRFGSPAKHRICKTNAHASRSPGCRDSYSRRREWRSEPPCLFMRKYSDSEVPAPYGSGIAPMRLYYLLGPLIGKSQERVARAKPLTGDVGVSPTIKFPLLLARRRGPGG